MRTTTRAATAALATLALVASACSSDDAGDAIDDAEEAVDDAEEAVDDAEEAVGDAVEEVADEVEEVAGDAEEAVEEVAEDAEGAASGDTIRIAVVAPSAVNDLAFTQSMIDSLDRVAEGRDIEVAVTDGTFIVEDGGAALRGYAEDGVDLVIAHGTQYGGPLAEIAAEFPDTAFGYGTSSDTLGLDNVFAYTVRADQGGYVNGVMAAQLSESGVIGVVGPVQAGDAALYVDGFVAGAAAQDAAVEVNVNYIESFSDVALAAEAATAHVENGADILTGTAQMVVGATGVAVDQGIPWFGTQSNQAPLGEDIVVASQEYHWEIVLTQILDAVEAGEAGSVFELTFENGGLEMIYNDGYTLDAAVRTAADDTVAGLTDGSISTGV
jgi:basic membrane lipoprotein Med (substrate-binding protein (PBP1-ABC) superfamily)